MAMTTLQNPVKVQLEAITNDLKEVTKAQKGFGKALDKVGVILTQTCHDCGADRYRHFPSETSPWKRTQWQIIPRSSTAP